MAEAGAAAEAGAEEEGVHSVVGFVRLYPLRDGAVRRESLCLLV